MKTAEEWNNYHDTKLIVKKLLQQCQKRDELIKAQEMLIKYIQEYWDNVVDEETERLRIWIERLKKEIQ